MEPVTQRGEPWFRARRADQGTGYGLIHWKGAVAVALTALGCAGIGLLPLAIFGKTDIAAVAGVILALSTFTILLLVVVRAKAERWEG